MNDFRVLVTGARRITSADTLVVAACLARVCRPALTAERPVVIIEGECPTGGVDKVARTWALATPGVTLEPYRADWDTEGPGAGPIRNQAMVNAGADICLAFPAPDSKGTWDCLQRAAKAGIPGRVYPIGRAR